MNYSKRQLEALGEPLGESVTQAKPGGFGRVYGSGGGGGATTSTTYTSGVPEWLRTPTEAVVGAGMQEYFNTEDVTDPETGEVTKRITGIKPFVPYSTRPEDYLAGFSPQQQQVFAEAANMYRPEGFGMGTQYADIAAQGGLGAAQQALGYGAEAADIGRMGLRAEALGRDVGEEARQYARRAAGMGGTYEQMATSPGAMQAYMSPYMQNVVELQKEAAIRDAQKSNLAANLGSVRSGTYGGARQLLAQTERERALGSQLQNIQAQGLQKAYEDAQKAQQFGITTGLQGLSGAQAGLGTALQGGQLGLSGIGQAIAGQQAGLQGVQGAISGYGLTGQQAANLANIAQQQQAADIARMEFQGKIGSQQQAREQAIIDQAIKNYQMAREYPFEQLSRYSGLIRGYYTPTTTQTSYQAYNPAAQAASLVAQGAGALGAMKKEGGHIKEKKYAKGGILDAEVLNDPISFSPEMIKRGMKNDSISDMIGAIGLSQINEARKQAKQSQALSKPAPEGTVLGDLEQQAMASQGIEAAPTQLPTTLAGGGIIAFAGEDGSLVEEEKEITTPTSIADYMKLSEKYLKKPKTKEEMEYEASLRSRPQELAKQREADRYLALMKFGAGMGRAKTRNFLQAVSEGTEAAIPQLAAGEKAYREGVAGAGKELAGLGAKTRAEEIESAKAGFDLYGRAAQRDASKSNLKEYAENYVAEKVAAGDKRDPKAIWNEGATKYAMIAAAPRYESAATQRFGQEQDIFKDIATERDSKIYRENARLAQIPIKPGMEPDIVKRIQDAKAWVASKEAEFERRAGQVRGGASAPAAAKPKASDQVTIGGKTYTKPANMTDAQWAKYKKDMGVQ